MRWIIDHAPQPGPLHWDYRCLVCSGNVDDHAGILRRWLLRRRLAKTSGTGRWSDKLKDAIN